MRLFISVLATTAMFLVASAASAVTFTVDASTSGAGLNALVEGDTVTLDIRVAADADRVTGLGASVFGYEGFADFTSGDAVASIFHDTAIIGVGAFTGLGSISGGALGEDRIGANESRVQIFNGVGLNDFGAQPLDPGLDGVVGGGDAQFRLVFTVAAGASGTALINIGTGYEGDAVILLGGAAVQANGGSVELTVVPEPGTALLMGLGLAGLAAAGRRS